MLWPVVLPLQITCCVLLFADVALTAVASPKTWGRGKAFLCYFAIALLAFAPAYFGIRTAVDAVRFGDFSYASYNDVSDSRSRRYLPETATDIQMRKHANGYLARYELSSDELTLYLNGLWRQHGDRSAMKRGGFSGEGESVDSRSFDTIFGDLGWACSPEATIHFSPRESDGGGATYYVDSEANLVFQRTAFW
ncbi:MAG: hypothetical protein Fues2KO_09390 [Fuerstiella sp.]